MKKVCCPAIAFKNSKCDVNYLHNGIEKMFLRKNKKGQTQVKINGKGKWINAEYDEANRIIKYYA